MSNDTPDASPVTQWLQQRQRRVLAWAYSDAQAIRHLETQYYDGGKISSTPDQSRTVYNYVRSLRDRKLWQIRANLAQFNFNSFVLNQGGTGPDGDVEDPAVVEKLDFIEAVIGKYRESPEDDLAQAAALMEAEDRERLTRGDADGAPHGAGPSRSLGLLKGRLGARALSPQYEQQVVQELRLQRQQQQVALRWLAILLVVPLAVGVLTRHLVFEPLLGNYSDANPNRIELSSEIREEFALRLNNYRELIEIQELMGMIPEMTPEMKREEVSLKATELWREAREEELTGLKNLLADAVALAVFAGLVYFNRSRLAILRSVTNRTFLNLSDPTKVFLFILLTDMFVGFHSAEGWAVILNGIGSHFGLPENEAAVGLFIATVPVILDACIKFWIFSYLTRFSPPSSAIYERMNT